MVVTVAHAVLSEYEESDTVILAYNRCADSGVIVEGAAYAYRGKSVGCFS